MSLKKYTIGNAIIDLVSAHRLITTSKISKLGLHAGQDMVLLSLLEKDGQSQNELVQQLVVTHSAIAKSVARMKRKDIVSTQKSTLDKRITLVYLTDKGRTLALEVQKIWENVEDIAFLKLNSSDKADFLRISAAIQNNFEENAKKDS